MTVVITGWNSTIAREFRLLAQEEYVRGDCVRDPDNFDYGASRYLFCQGILFPKPIQEQTYEEKVLSREVNFRTIRDACEKIINNNYKARICIIGSESGFRGSYDGSYHVNKAAIHDYIKTRKLIYPTQQLVGIAPSIIEDSAMTQARTDYDNLEKRRSTASHTRRFLKAHEVAALAYDLLYRHPYVSGTVVRMHGGWVA